MDRNGNQENSQFVRNLTNEDLLFYQDFGRNLAVRPNADISLEEWTTLADKKASRLRAMLAAGAISTDQDLVEWDDTCDPPEPICMMTSDRYVAAQIQMEEVIRLQHDDGFYIRWGEDGMAVFESENGVKISVKLW